MSSRSFDRKDLATPPGFSRTPDAIAVERDHESGTIIGRDIGLSMHQHGSPLTRAGLLQPRSYASSSNLSAALRHGRPIPHSQDDIRASTMLLSNMRVASTPLPADKSSHHGQSFIFPTVDRNLDEAENQDVPPFVSVSFAPSSQFSETSSGGLAASTSTIASANVGTTTPRGRADTLTPSGLSLLLAQHEISSPTSPERASPMLSTPTVRAGSVTPRPADEAISLPPTIEEPATDRRPRSSPTASDPAEVLSESAPLLSDLEAARLSYTTNGSAHSSKPYVFSSLSSAAKKVKRASRPDNLKGLGANVVRSLPAVLLGTLLNILDGVSYGMIIFPAAGVFEGLGPMGVSMFFVSAIISQLVYSFGGSGFAGANGSMMIEVVPFFHILATSIAREIGEDKPQEIIATTMVAFAFSSVLTGLTFFVLGALRLGILIGFFPRHILVGCIGGVGIFLIITGLSISTRLNDDEFTFSLDTFKYLFLSAHNLALWAPAFGLAVLLRTITHKFQHQLIFPMYFLIIPAIFYAIIMAAHLNLGVLRKEGWLFDIATSDEPWYHFYTYYDFRATRFGPLISTMPTQLALLFFNILHPPLNVPALAVSLDIDVDTNKELVGHGYSNLLAGFLGTVPNYLVYVNTLLFYRVGGDTRVAGFLLAGATILLLIVGTGPIAYIPVMVVGALIFVLGIDLVKEALWDTRHRVSRFEYITIASIMVVMTVWDFVMGVLFGIVVSCFFFVLQNSQRHSIRALHTGETVMSTVRRPSAHRAYIREVSKQTTILRLQGFLFFGTITHVEETIRGLVDGPQWQQSPIRFLVMDLTLAAGVDMSAAEAFVRVQRLLAAKRIILVLCGFSSESPIGSALGNVGLLQEDSVELFSTLNDAMEWTENAYLRTWFSSQKAEGNPVSLPGRQDTDLGLHHSLSSSPRRSRLAEAGLRTIARDKSIDRRSDVDPEPYNTLVKAFSSYGESSPDHFPRLIPYLERVSAPEGLVLWYQGDQPDGLYIIEAGILRATYKFAEFTPLIEESMVPGTLAGELSALSGEPRNATVMVERQAILWKLTTGNLRRLEAEDPHLANSFTKLVLKAAKIDYDILLSSLATRQ